MKDIDNERTVKENIKIIEHKLWNTKKVMNGRYNMRIYKRCPKNIMFKNNMINDMNQNLCGGWWFNWIGSISFEQDEVLLSRVLNYQKPLGVITHFNRSDINIMRLCESYIENDIDSNLFDTEIIKENPDPIIYEDRVIQQDTTSLMVARKGLMKDLFDLETLQKDYENNGIEIDIEPVKNKSLKDYFFDWDAQDSESDIETWETGLILGYPIENTISLYKE